MQDDSVFNVDKRQARRSFERAAMDYDKAAILQREVADRLLERLDYLKMTPQRVLDVGTGTGYCLHRLIERYPNAQHIGLDLALPMLQQARRRSSWWQRLRKRICYMAGDAEHLPLADASVDMLISNLTVQWCGDLQQALSEFRRVLAPGGVLFFTSFGPDTLKELRTSWAAADNFNHVNAFLDMHDVGDALMRSGFAEPVMDAEHLTMTYPDVMSVMRDIKTIGAHNVTSGRQRGLMGKGRLGRMQQHYESLRENGVLPVSYEVVYGHAWAPVQDSREDMSRVTIPISSILNGRAD